MALRALIVLHRWIGVCLCVLFALWFASGIGMMYWGMPSVTARDRLARAPAIDPSRVLLSPREAMEKAGEDRPPSQVRLITFDGRPAYDVANQIVYADTGELQGPASEELRGRVAAAWTGLPLRDARIDPVTEPDQWTVGSALRNLRPLWKYSWPNGEQVYIGESGEVLQYTTRSSRLAAYVSAVPHWLYFTPLRKHQPFWIRFATYSAMVGTAGAIIGVVIGVWLYSPARKYRFAGAPSRIPFRGWKRSHTVLGLIFGVATITWTFSGSLAFLPFPTPQPAGQVRVRPGSGPGQAPGQVQGLVRGQAPGQGRPRGAPGRRVADAGLAAALRGRVSVDQFERLHPRDVLSRFPDLPIREIGMTSFDGQPLYSLALADGTSRLLSMDGTLVDGLDHQRIIDIVRKSAPDPQAVETRLIERYDAYYLDRTRQRPLPVILARMNDAANTRYYIDPKTATIVGTASDRNFWRRWLYNGLHSLNFPWLYEYRPLWDIVVISFMLGGMALSLTSLMLAWRAIGRSVGRLFRDNSAVRQRAAAGHVASGASSV